MKGAWGMAKDQLTGDSADDKNYDPKLSPLQAFQNSSKLTANQSVDHLEAFVESMATLGGMALGGLGGAVGAKFVGALGETGNKYDFHMDDGHSLKIIEKSSRFSTDPCCDCCCGEPGKGGCWGLCFIPTGRVLCAETSRRPPRHRRDAARWRGNADSTQVASAVGRTMNSSCASTSLTRASSTRRSC
jgi:hypothetical protein